MRLDLWARWKRFAQRAAEFQGQILFGLLYFLCVVPMGYLTRRGQSTPKEPPHWVPVEQAPVDVVRARRQY